MWLRQRRRRPKGLGFACENFEHAGHAFAEHGIDVRGVSLDLARMLARKDKVVAQNNDGILYLFRKHKIAFLHGRRVCKPRPLCDRCAVRDYCDYLRALEQERARPPAGGPRGTRRVRTPRR